METRKILKVLVADDSAFMRKTISAILNKADDMEVVATARDGLDALQKITDYKPDVITLDIEMPRLAGLETLGYIMSECPTPVVILSAYTESGGETTMKALEYGAVDFISKPSGPISLDMDEVADSLVTKVRMASQVEVSRLKFLEFEKFKKSIPEFKALTAGQQIVVIASSTGGPRALYEVIPGLPADFPAAVLVVQHMSPGFTHLLAERLDQISELRVKEAEEGDVILAGQVYLAPSRYHMIAVNESGRKIIRLHRGPARHNVRPSADVTMESVAELYGCNTLAVVLTGMGRDGAQGAVRVKEKGGQSIAQNEATSVVFGMPRAVQEAGAADGIYPINEIRKQIIRRMRMVKLGP
ncbi:chemotaxis response regulator protein-glutamate methylesterase [bacterium]|nr:chemotaxis response regulator protein-glutamate methylesterase [bacterium]